MRIMAINFGRQVRYMLDQMANLHLEELIGARLGRVFFGAS